MNLSLLLEDQRRQLTRNARFFRIMLVFGTFLAAVCFFFFVTAYFKMSIHPVTDRFFFDDPSRATEAGSLFATFAFGSAVKVWRIRQERLKMLIAQAFVLEGDNDAAVRLLLGKVFGGDTGALAASRLIEDQPAAQGDQP